MNAIIIIIIIIIQYLTNGLKMWKMTQRFVKWPKYFSNGLDIWGTA